MPINNEWKAPAGESFPVIAEGVYQVFIEDAEIKEIADYNDPTKNVEVIKFTFTILDDSDFHGQKLWKNARPYFSDKPGQKKSTLTEIFEAVFKTTPTQVGIKELTGGIINKFLGKQLNVVVKTTMSGKGHEYSKIGEGGFMKAKSDLPLPEGLSLNLKPSNDPVVPTIRVNEEGEPIDLSSIPF